ncbi:hypothetical protein L1987_62881 [Smallanthus sonchifolius]|uniref:Uncharacterized protein n=1 Tax=Smallanthus sonchifolius TaxID=185202 RepID=A0ACB9CBQ2_9ASTR|nr:hypothetical protein L1987_62881 [Smallanthus sonchifolius]
MLLLTHSLPELQSITRDLKSKYGPLVSLSIGSHPSVFIGSHSLTHQVLIQNGTTFSDRPEIYPLRAISTASYGPIWRTFRHNLTSNFLRPSNVKSYSCARKYALGVMISRLQKQQQQQEQAVGTIKVIDHIYLAILRLSVLMCFGEKLDDSGLNDMASVHDVVGPPPPIVVDHEPELVITEEKLQKIPYLKAVILEGLRRHPPGHLVLPHRVTKEVELQGYKTPKGATINFMVAEMGWDPDVWDEPMEFKPERFLLNDGSGVGFDVGGSKGIKMMPFGAGRRICPGADLALLHLEYFVANLIWYFHWSVADGYVVDLAEQVKFKVVMKNPLETKIISRTKGQPIDQ